MRSTICGASSPLQIVVAATRNGAYACGKSGEIGTLEPGKCADIVVVNGDPRDDLHSLQDVRLVLKNGHVARGQEHAGV